MKRILLILSFLISFSAMAYTTSYTKYLFVAGDSCAEIKELMNEHMPRVKAYYKSRNQVITNLNIEVCDGNSYDGQQQGKSQLTPGLNVGKNEVNIMNKEMSQKVVLDGYLLVRDI